MYISVPTQSPFFFFFLQKNNDVRNFWGFGEGPLVQSLGHLIVKSKEETVSEDKQEEMII